MTCKQGQITVIIAVGILQTVDVQFMYPVQQPVYMMPPPPPPPVAVPVPYPVAVPYRVTQKTTTTTTKKPEESAEKGIPVPIAIPMPVPYAVPAAPPPMFCVSKPRTPGCPPCPPCFCKPICTPAFFSYCSPCHQMCRCRYNEAPMPLPPVPVYAPPAPQVVVVPFPPPLPRLRPRERDCGRKYVSSTEDESSSDSRYDSSESPSSGDNLWVRKRRIRPKYLRKRRLRAKNYRKFLKDRENSDTGDNNLVKPVLAYISENGKVMFEKRINEDDAARLMSKNMNFEREEQPKNIKSSRQMIQTKEITRRNKEVIFKTPPNKRVSNLSVSFRLV